MRVASHAKANLVLDLGEKLPSGRYQIDYVMQEIDLHDIIEIKPNNESSIVLSASNASVPLDESNFCYIAAELLQAHAGGSHGASIYIEKYIPVAGGLGGGSSNAAAVAKALNKLWKINFEDRELIALLNPKLGTDTSFFIKGGTAHVTEDGLSVEPVCLNTDIAYVFALPEIPPLANKTARMFEQFEPSSQGLPPKSSEMLLALKTELPAEVASCLYNAFEKSLPTYYAPVLKAKQRLIDLGSQGALMCGAGPIVFGICKSLEEAIAIQDKIKNEFPLVFVTQTRMDK